jgi:hypothetical protein
LKFKLLLLLLLSLVAINTAFAQVPTFYNLTTEEDEYVQGEVIITTNYVLNESGDPLEGATVVNRYFDSNGVWKGFYSCTTNSFGLCTTNYSLEDDAALGIWLVGGSAVFGKYVVDNSTTFEVTPLCGNGLCQDETVSNCPQDCCDTYCTATYDNYCHPECDGYNGCDFYDETSESTCDSVIDGAEVCYDGYRKLICCEGTPLDCPTGYYCSAGACYEGCLPDGVCDTGAGENCQNCLDDCPSDITCGTCENAICSPATTGASLRGWVCQTIYPCCGNFICEPEAGEDYINCPEDCAPPAVTLEVISPEHLESFNRGDEVRVVVNLTTNEIPLTGASVVATLQFPELVSLNLYDDGKHNDSEANDGIYGNSHKLGKVPDGEYDIVITAMKDAIAIDAYTKIAINSLLLMNFSSDKDEYPRGGKIILEGNLKSIKGRAIKNASIKLIFSLEDFYVEDFAFTNEEGKFSYSYLISFADPTGKWKITASAMDEDENTASLEIEISVITVPGVEYYGVTLLSPIKDEKYERGGNVTIRAKVIFKEEPLSGAEVSCRLPNGTLVILKEKEPGVYSYTYQISHLDPLGKWRVGVSARKGIYGGGSYIVVEIIPLRILIELIEPVERTFSTGQIIKIVVIARYASGEFVKGGLLKLIDPRGETIVGEESDGQYVAYYQVTPEDEGVWDLQVDFEDKYANKGSFVKTVVLKKVVPFTEVLQRNVRMIVPLLAISIVSLLLARVAIQRKLMISRLARLEEEKERVIKMRDETEQRYFDRSIDEKTYEKLMREHQAKLIELTTKIDSLKSRLARRRFPRLKLRKS